MTTKTNPMKTLTKIRLINWHYFTDETIDVKGSVLFSGENASGKSTILDAIQLVLTTNTTKFNPAANEKSKRKLNGYVRCKTGEEGNTYVRNAGAVISYVALEFYEESKDKYFVLGVKLDSPDVEADIKKKWFCVEGRMDTLTFIVNGKPAIDKEFTQNGKRIQFDTQKDSAKDKFKIRLGRLDDKFEEMIYKSMAFRPMDKVKDFINTFILPESYIQTDSLQENIRNLREMQKLINEVKSQIDQLHAILSKADEIENKENDILIIDILINIARLEDLNQNYKKLQEGKEADQITLDTFKKEKAALEEALNSSRNKLTDLQIALSSNETGRLIERIRHSIDALENDKYRLEQSDQEYQKQIGKLEIAVASLKDDKLSIETLRSLAFSTQEKAENLQAVKTRLIAIRDSMLYDNSKIDYEIENIDSSCKTLREKIDKLNKNQIVYPENTTKLLDAINSEFESRRKDTKAYVFADLLDINMPEWQDAVEGYLNTQRFNIIVEPEYFGIASQVYDKHRKTIHSVGLVNTGKILKEGNNNVEGTLAEAVKSENRFARAYANYLLGRVIRCERVEELKDHSISITRSCMKYQGHVLSKIDEAIYRDPYIGKAALEVQLKKAKEDLNGYTLKKQSLAGQKRENETVISKIGECNFDQIKTLLSVPENLIEVKKRIQKEREDLSEAEKNPSYIELGMQVNAASAAVTANEKILSDKNKDIINKERDIADKEEKLITISGVIATVQDELNTLSEEHPDAYNSAKKRFEENLRTKNSKTIAENYSPRKQTLINQKNQLERDMTILQLKYKDNTFGTGMDVIQNYRNDLDKLERSDLISYEDKLSTIQKECELEFRESFLVKMRENIEKAEMTFGQLNKSLKGIYYGNDSYKFLLTSNKQYQSLYDMITSKVNVSGDNLFSSAFEDKYHEEMEDLFNKLADENLSDSKVVKELTDYRSYLDYDIQVISKDGKYQNFSKTYAEKSGGETQTPYYVAIAASFAQMYSDRETTRIVMLDEAFNNMDEDRIESMMKFFKSQNFQIILAAPPARMEIIGEHVDSIYLTIRQGNTSVVEEYFYEGL